MTTIKIKSLDIKDQEQIIAVLSAAFEKDPLMYYFFGDEYHNLAKYFWQYICAIKNLLKVGQTYVGMTPSALVPLRFTGVSDDLPNNFLFDAEPWLLGLTPTLTFISK